MEEMFAGRAATGLYIAVPMCRGRMPISSTTSFRNCSAAVRFTKDYAGKTCAK